MDASNLLSQEKPVASAVAAMLSDAQLSEMRAVFRDTAKGFRKSNGKWPVVIGMLKDEAGIVVEARRKAAASACREEFVSYELECRRAETKRKDYELSAVEDKAVRNTATSTFSQYLKHNGVLPKKTTRKARAGAGKDDAAAGATGNVGNAIPGIVNVTHKVENAMALAAKTMERLAGFQTALAALNPGEAMMESIGTIAVNVGDIRDLLAETLGIVNGK